MQAEAYSAPGDEVARGVCKRHVEGDTAPMTTLHPTPQLGVFIFVPELTPWTIIQAEAYAKDAGFVSVQVPPTGVPRSKETASP